MMKLAACILFLVAIGQAAAWDCPGGLKGSDQVTGNTNFYGIKEDKPLKYIDQTTAWKKFGPITKVNLYYSYNHNCIQGIKVTYGYDSRNAQLVGVQKGLTEADLTLGAYEHITKVEIKEGNSNKCVEWIRLTSNKTRSVSLGNAKSTNPIQTTSTNKKDGFLATIRAYEDYYAGQAVTKGGLQQLQFVWAVAICPQPVQPAPTPAPASAPAPAPAPSDEPPAPTPVEGPPEGTEEPLCPPVEEQCDTESKSGDNTCVANTPFSAPQCVGGCCLSSGKCKKGFCKSVGLGYEVFAPHMLCWGTNSFPLNRINKCRSLACKLAVPGCVGDLISGACVGSVVALSDDVDEGAKQWVGYPCLQTVPGGLPVDALGKPDVNGAYAAKLWSICDCKSKKLGICKGPLCELFKRPELPSFNFAMPGFNLQDLFPLIDPTGYDWSQLALLIPEFPTPKVTIRVPQVQPYFNDIKEHAQGTIEAMVPIIQETVLDYPPIPTFTVNTSAIEAPEVTINLPTPTLDPTHLVPEVDLSHVPINTGIKTINLSNMTLSDVNVLDKALKAADSTGKGKKIPTPSTNAAEDSSAEGGDAEPAAN